MTRPPRKSDFAAYRGRVFRMVEAQHRISTSRLAGSLLDEERLERLVEEVKPPMPRAAQGLHHLLATPFRYGHRSASRFRRAGERPGIFYASESTETCLAEMAYWRLKFFAAAPAARLPGTTTEHLMFSARVAGERTLDLTNPPFAADRARWTDPNDYSACQLFADRARKIDTQAIRYESVRDPGNGRNLALLDPACFERPMPKAEGTWHFRFRAGHLTAIAAAPSDGRYEFGFDQFGLGR